MRNPSARRSEPCSFNSCRTEFRTSELFWWAMRFCLLVVFVDTPTRNQCGLPSTNFSAPPPLVGAAALRLAPLTFAPPPPQGGLGLVDKQFTETLLHPLFLSLGNFP